MKRIGYIIGTYILMTYSLSAIAQNTGFDILRKSLAYEQEDTNKVNILNELCKQYNELAYYDSGRKYSAIALSLAKKINFEKGIAFAYVNFASSYYDRKIKFDSLIAFEYLRKALDFFEKNEDKGNAAACYLNFGKIYFSFHQNFPEATKFFLTALKQYEAIGDKQGIANCFQLIGLLYINNDNTETGQKYTLDALSIFEALHDSLHVAYLKVYLGLFYSDSDQSKALESCSDGLKIYAALGNKAPLFGLPWGHGTIGTIYQGIADAAYKSGNLSNAKKYSDLAFQQLELRVKLEEERGLFHTDSYLLLGDHYVSLSKMSSSGEKRINLEKAEAYYKNLLLIAQQTNNRFGLLNSYNRLIVVDTLLERYKTAFDYYRLYNLYLDSVVNEENTKKISQSQMQYENEKKDALAKAAQAVKDTEAKRIKNQQDFAIAVLGIVVLAVVVIAFIQWRNSKDKQKANLLLQEQKEKVEGTLSELKSTQAQLIQSEKMASLGQLTAGIAHEIQNPLNFVNNFSEVNKELIEELRVEKGDPQVQEEIISDIEQNLDKIIHHGKRAESIVKSMLQHSRASAGKRELTNINALVDECLRLSYHGMRAKDKEFNAEIKTELDGSIGKVNVVPQDISRVLINLLNNAFYAVDEKKRQLNGMYEPVVSVCTKKLDGKVEIQVKDNGNGIPQNIVDKIFQPFFTTKPTGQGTGLGLSLSYDIIKAHGGEIRVESKEGEGSELIIQLPMHS